MCAWFRYVASTGVGGSLDLRANQSHVTRAAQRGARTAEHQARADVELKPPSNHPLNQALYSTHFSTLEAPL